MVFKVCSVVLRVFSFLLHDLLVLAALCVGATRCVSEANRATSAILQVCRHACITGLLSPGYSSLSVNLVSIAQQAKRLLVAPNLTFQPTAPVAAPRLQISLETATVLD